MAVPDPAYTVVPANVASPEDLRKVFGTRGTTYRCQCQRYKLAPQESFARFPVEDRAQRLQEQADCGHPRSGRTSGLVAYLDGEPVGWCAVEPRPAYIGLVRNSRVPWEGRDEDKGDESVWAVTCIFVRVVFWGCGVACALAKAAVAFARERGARALEGYPIVTRPGQQITWDEAHPGGPSVFEAAGLVEVHRPTLRRRVLRIDFR